jgi:PilZ domain
MEREIAGRSRNVSRGGLCAEVDEELPAGSSIEIDLQLVFGDARQSEPLRLPARIAWCTPIDAHFQVGVQFLPVHEETAADLTMFLRFLDGRGIAERIITVARTPRPASIDERFG